MKKGLKKKIIALALVAALGASAAIGGTLAYFTDTDAKTNEFVVGNVNINLIEDFDEDAAKDLLPGRDIEKLVAVQNTGVNDAYVRVHIAIPQALDDGDPNFNASQNFLHFNFESDSVVDKQWSWLPEYSEGSGYKGNGKGHFNFYTTQVDGKWYNVYVVTYRSVLGHGEITGTDALSNVYMDPTVDTVVIDGVEYYKDTKGNKVKVEEFKNFDILVAAEGTQAEGFANAYEALDTAFGKPGTYTVNWTPVYNEPVIE